MDLDLDPVDREREEKVVKVESRLSPSNRYRSQGSVLCKVFWEMFVTSMVEVRENF